MTRGSKVSAIFILFFGLDGFKS